MRRREFIAGLGAAVWPLKARAQQSSNPVIGWLSSVSEDTAQSRLVPFREALRDAGLAEGRNVQIEYRWAKGNYDLLPGLAADLVARHVDVIVTTGGEPSALAAKATGSSIPVVTLLGGDPIKTGLFASINRPGGNFTGVSIFANSIESKRLGLLHEVVPSAGTIAVLTNPNNPVLDQQLRDVRDAAATLGVELLTLSASSETEVGQAFDRIGRQHPGALQVCGDPFFNNRRKQLVSLAARHRTPAIYEWREFVADGGLMSYGTVLSDGYRQAGNYAARIIKGEKPGELPVVQTTRFEFVINADTAKRLGLTFSPTLLARTDEVIE